MKIPIRLKHCKICNLGWYHSQENIYGFAINGLQCQTLWVISYTPDVHWDITKY